MDVFSSKFFIRRFEVPQSKLTSQVSEWLYVRYRPRDRTHILFVTISGEVAQCPALHHTQGSGEGRRWSALNSWGTTHDVLAKVMQSSSSSSTLNGDCPQLHVLSNNLLFSLRSVHHCRYVCSSNDTKLKAILKLVVSFNLLPIHIDSWSFPGVRSAVLEPDTTLGVQFALVMVIWPELQFLW